ncbi:YihY/virulence factor BrkB family protein [Synechococcus sp. CS-1324]|uniref:YihY/virulence factor BrkB family protein n=1 Tax=Synechococcus sp. CS-1324 TaxID=2847980 RepID=UPI000DB20950|nr:YihY/virulence factor BrkB family protein [Synechococcus sp. CS-1324]MCT0231286.1 YihY/virulence factor BrkB family protein [Synechococcus sp. CS-1324]PZV04666.1 MAG: YihY/virulence factor BrkB family protein [Cyanobium sp.]
MIRFRQWIRTAWLAYRVWDRHDCIDLSAAFAYHMLQSIFPVLLIALALASRILGRDEGLIDQIASFADEFLPAAASPFIQTTLVKLYSQRGGAGAFGAVALLVTASNTYLTLQRGADRLWGWRDDPSGLKRKPVSRVQALQRFVALRLKAFALVAVAGLLLAVSQLTSNLAVINPQTWGSLFRVQIPWLFRLSMPVAGFTDLLFSVLVSAAVGFVLLRIIPSRTVPVPALWPGSLLIGVAYTLLNVVVGRSLVSLSSRFQAYGVVSGVLVLTLWVWLLGLILYYGMAVSVVLSRRSWGGRSTPVAAVQISHPGGRMKSVED